VLLVALAACGSSTGRGRGRGGPALAIDPDGYVPRVRLVDRFDAFQRRHSWAGIPIAVGYKVFDDRAVYLAALITYYGFVSLFPLLLLFFSTVGFFLHGDPELQRRLAGSALRDFPIVGPQLRHNVSSFKGSGAALAVGIVGSLYGGLGIMQAAQAAFNQMYGIPRNEQPNPLTSRVRSLALLLLLGGGIVATTGLTIFVGTVQTIGGTAIGPGLTILGMLLAYALNVALFAGAFQLLTARELGWSDVLTGGLIAAASWQLLQAEGTRYLAHKLTHASEVYGSFALVLALLAYIYLQALFAVIGVEVNVVLHHRLWPRALLTPFTDDVELTDVDRRLYASYAQAQRFKGFQRIEVEFEDEQAADASAADAPPRRGRVPT
jgi:YihY family inner membrane protein